MKTLRRLRFRILGYALIPVLLFVLLSIGDLASDARDRWPSAREVLVALDDLARSGFRGQSLWEMTWASLQRVGVASIVGGSIGALIGTVSRRHTVASEVAAPSIAFFRLMPVPALMVVSITLWGLDAAVAGPALVVVALLVAHQTHHGPADHALGGIARSALLVSWLLVLTLEMFAAASGLGAAMQGARSFGRFDVLLAAAIWSTGIAFVFDQLLEATNGALAGQRRSATSVR